jgi:hypothetical protein
VDDLFDGLDAAEELGKRHDDDLVYRFPWLPIQMAFLCDDSRAKDLRTGNQGLGKTTAGLAEDIFYATGRHPFRPVPPPPCRIRVICATASQSIEIQEKLWHLVPKRELVPGTEFVTGSGFRGRDPKRVRFKNGSLITFHTSYQSAIAQAGGTVDRIHFDEPPKSDRVFVEAKNRMIKTGGTLILTFAPVNAPVEYLRELIAAGQLSDHHAPMTQEQMTPVGATEPITDKFGRPFTDEYIAELKAGVPAYQVPVVFDGEWEFYTTDRVFTAFDPETMITEELPTGEVDLSGGIDHGEGDFREVFEGCAIYPSLVAPGQFGVHFLSEYASDGATTTGEDAEGIVAALDEIGLSWSDLDHAVGDKPTTGRVGRKSNQALAIALRRIYARRGHRGELRPALHQAKTGKGGNMGSVWHGITFLHQAMLRGEFRVHPRCKRLVQSLLKWDGTAKSEWKDAIDAARYATWRYAMRPQVRPTAQVQV